MVMQVGDKVDYHSIIDGPATSTGHEIIAIYPKGERFGCDVAFISGKSGCVAVEALSLTQLGQPPARSGRKGSRMTRVLEMRPRTTKPHLSWEKQQEIKSARDIRAKAKRRAKSALASASRKKNRRKA